MIAKPMARAVGRPMARAMGGSVDGFPIPPSGFIFITDADGAYLTDADGAYILEAI